MDIRDEKILLVDDERPVLEYLAMALAMRGCSPLPFDNGDKALSSYLTLRSEGMQPKIAVIDDKLVGSTITGLDLVKKIRERDPECIIVLISSSDLSGEVKLAAGLAIDKFMLKPITGEDLMAEIRVAMEMRFRAIPMQSKAANGSDSQMGFLSFTPKEAVMAFVVLICIAVTLVEVTYRSNQMTEILKIQEQIISNQRLQDLRISDTREDLASYGMLNKNGPFGRKEETK